MEEKLTVLLQTDLVERVKNAAYWNLRLTMRWPADRPAQERRTHKQGDTGNPETPVFPVFGCWQRGGNLSLN